MINKKYLPPLTIVVLLLIAGLAILAVNLSQPPKTSKQSNEYTDQATGLRITPPKGWDKPDKQPTGVMVEFEAVQAKHPKPTINIIAVPAEGTLDQYIKAISVNNSKQFENYAEIGGQKIVIDGAPGAILEYSAKVDGYDLRYSELVAIKHSAYYQVTGTTATGSWNQYRDAIETSLKSVKLK